jgi:CRP-like cAMP-binding protein
LPSATKATAPAGFATSPGRLRGHAGESGVEQSLGTLTPPNYFGEIGLLEHRPRTATVKALTPYTLYRINGTDFVEALTVSTLSPSALGRAQMRLARTHPSLSMTFGDKPPE